MPVIKLPTFEEARQKVLGNSADPIETFIEENEPARPHDILFRHQLVAALNHAATSGAIYTE